MLEFLLGSMPTQFCVLKKKCFALRLYVYRNRFRRYIIPVVVVNAILLAVVLIWFVTRK
jgi:hypothetical protein